MAACAVIQLSTCCAQRVVQVWDLSSGTLHLRHHLQGSRGLFDLRTQARRRSSHGAEPCGGVGRAIPPPSRERRRRRGRRRRARLRRARRRSRRRRATTRRRAPARGDARLEPIAARAARVARAVMAESDRHAARAAHAQRDRELLHVGFARAFVEARARRRSYRYEYGTTPSHDSATNTRALVARPSPPVRRVAHAHRRRARCSGPPTRTRPRTLTRSAARERERLLGVGDDAQAPVSLSLSLSHTHTHTPFSFALAFSPQGSSSNCSAIPEAPARPLSARARRARAAAAAGTRTTRRRTARRCTARRSAARPRPCARTSRAASTSTGGTRVGRPHRTAAAAAAAAARAPRGPVSARGPSRPGPAAPFSRGRRPSAARARSSAAGTWRRASARRRVRALVAGGDGTSQTAA